jgi:hypothetical protein
MKLRLLLLLYICSSHINVLLAEPPSCSLTNDEVMVFTEPVFTDALARVKDEVVPGNAIRIVTTPGEKILTSQNLFTVYAERPGLSWMISSTNKGSNLKNVVKSNI